MSSVLPVRPQPKLEAEPKKFKSEESTSGAPSSSSDRVETNVKSDDADSKVVVEEQKETVSSAALNSDKMIVDEVPITQSKAIDAQPGSSAETMQVDNDEEVEEDIGEVFVVSNPFPQSNILILSYIRES